MGIFGKSPQGKWLTFDKVMRMKRGLAFSLAIVILGIQLTPANAGLFGKSKCEKVAIQVSEQELIGKNLWNKLDSAWAARQSSGDVRDNRLVVLASIDLYTQYSKTLKIGMDNSSCYNSKQIADMISYRSEMALIIKNAKTWINAVSWNGFWKKPKIDNKFYTFKEMIGK